MTEDWATANQRYLMAALNGIRATLAGFAGHEVDAQASDDLAAAADAMPAPPALQVLTDTFGLSPFERDLLVLCAGVELHSDVGPLCATLQGDPRATRPTFSLALAALPEAHWSAITPSAPLRYWRLLELGPHDAMTTAPLRIEERVLHFLTGQHYLDERLEGLVSAAPRMDIAQSHMALGRRIATAWSASATAGEWPLVELLGADAGAARAVASAACRLSGLRLHVLPTDLVTLVTPISRIWEREAVLDRGALLVEGDTTERSVARLVERLVGPVLVSGREPSRIQRQTLRFDVRPPTPAEQREVWCDTLGVAGGDVSKTVDAVVQQFTLSTNNLRAARAEAVQALSQSDAVGDVLWSVCRGQARAQLSDLAQRIEPVATWDDLILPAPQQQLLRDIAQQVRQRTTVYEEWGFAARSARGLGVSALFAGPSGTGKTMAAEVLANELRLDLYCIDLSSVVSKYIGETEKNLRRVFDAAEESGAILLFDEADALFGKRTEVKDSHDRYANIEVSYLLQRMEAYRGLAVLTSNLKSGLDSAFMRRLRFVVQFPFPDAIQRAEIWRRVFPEATPVAELDHLKLARLNVAGGNIRTIALNAAFIAADSDQPVSMKHVLHAASVEYVKLERALTEAEVGGWI